MTTAHHLQTIASSFVQPTMHIIGPATRELAALGKDRGWEFAILGRAPMLAEPVRLGDWLMVPISQDSSQVPARAVERVQAIYAAGLRPQGFVLVHEAPLLLAAPAPRRQHSLEVPALSPQFKSALAAGASVVGAAALGLAGIAGIAVLVVAAVSLAAVLAVPAALLIGAALVDPILVAVTEDGYWIEIDRWASQGG